MATFRAADFDNTDIYLGDVFVSRVDGRLGENSLRVMRHPVRGLTLSDRHGMAVAPKSARLGYHARRGSWTKYLVQDTITDEVVRELLAAGYPCVEHGSAVDPEEFRARLHGMGVTITAARAVAISRAFIPDAPPL